MKLSEVLNLGEESSIISIAGGGGKTSTIFALAGELVDKKVLLTTTTKILKPEESNLYDIEIVSDSSLFLEKLKSGTLKKHIVCGSASKEYPGKLVGCGLSFIRDVKDFFDYLIIESDGSAGRPIKAPAIHEPVISEFTKIYIGIIGLDCLGKDGSDNYVHRPELFAQIRGKSQKEDIDVSDIIKLINSPKGLFKNAPQSSRKIALINKGDLIGYPEGVSIINRIFDERDFPIEVILNTYRQEKSVLYYRK